MKPYAILCNKIIIPQYIVFVKTLYWFRVQILVGNNDKRRATLLKRYGGILLNIFQNFRLSGGHLAFQLLLVMLITQKVEYAMN